MTRHLNKIPELTRLVIPKVTMFLAALSRPCLSLKSAHLALPITVPPLTDTTPT